jgi:HEAT repeat protein
MAAKKKLNVDAMIEAVAGATEDPMSAHSDRILREALGHKNWYVVSEAAGAIGKHGLAGFEKELSTVWNRFVNNPAKIDPGCRAKCAALTALDQLESFDPDPFLVAVGYVQMEPVLGGRADTAGNVRQRALYALLRMCHSDALLYAGKLLADTDPHVRMGAAAGLGHYGGPPCAGMLVLKAELGDDDPTVVLEVAQALLAVAPDFGLRLCERWLHDDEPERREAASLAIGQSEQPRGIALLVGMLEDGLDDHDFSIVTRGLGLTRNDDARAALIHVVQHGARSRAETALHALSVHSYDPKLAERVRAAVAKNSHAKLKRLAARLFRD